MNRINRIAFILLVLLSAFGVYPLHSARAATEWVVVNTNDSGAGSLRQAIADASSGDSITFNASLVGGTIHLASELVVNKSLVFLGGNLNPPIQISGDTDSDGDGDVQLMTIEAPGIVSIYGINFFNGKNTSLFISGGINNFGSLGIYGCTFSGNTGDQGGAIRNSGELTVNDSAFNNNSAPDGGAILNDIGATTTIDSSTFTQNSAGGPFGSGGAIGNIGNLTVTLTEFSENTATFGGGAIVNALEGTAIISDATFSSNTAGWKGGGAIYNDSGSIVLTNSVFSLNSTTSDGGAIFNGAQLDISNTNFISNSTAELRSGGAIANSEGANLTITANNFAFNTSGYGAGINNYLGTVTVESSTFEDNAARAGGGIYTDHILTVSNSTFTRNSGQTPGPGLYGGGAIHLFLGGTATITNSTIAGNSSPNGGGIVTMELSSLTLINSTLSDNTGGSLYIEGGDVHLKNDILANSISQSDCYNVNGSIVTNLNSLIENNAPGINSCGTPSITSDPNLGALADNTGSTQTMALLPGSPAIDAGDDATCATTDQRGILRPQGSHCDIGAYELKTGAITFKSTGAQDGWILESTETSGNGGTMNSTASTLNLGDDSANRQYRAILAFDTAPLPDNAVITKTTLKFKYFGVTGTNPFNTHGNLLVDIRKGPFGGNPALQLGDFKATANKNNMLSFANNKVNNWYTKLLSSSSFAYINRTSVTQFRLRFQTDDNHDFGADFLKIYSGNAGAANRPQLIIEYYVP